MQIMEKVLEDKKEANYESALFHDLSLPYLLRFIKNIIEKARQINESQLTDYFQQPEFSLAAVQMQEDIKICLVLLDRLLSTTLDSILHNTCFRKLEASWRGLNYLVTSAIDYKGVKIRLLDVSWALLSKDLGSALDYDQSQFFKKVYEAEFGMPGGEPYGLLIGDYYLGDKDLPETPITLSTLHNIGQVASAAFVPFVLGALPSIFGVGEWEELYYLHSITPFNNSNVQSYWNKLQESSVARFVGVAIPQVLIRKPYVRENARIEGFLYEETPRSNASAGHLWCNACYCFGQVVARAFSEDGWLANIKGLPQTTIIGGGLVEGIPQATFGVERGNLSAKYSLNTIITPSLVKDLGTLGFLCITHVKYLSLLVFPHTPSIQKVSKKDSEITNINSSLSSKLNYVLCVSRFAHYIKVIMRNKLGSIQSIQELETFLSTWLLRYTASTDGMTDALLVKYPLRASSVQFKEAPGNPYIYSCILYLQPQYQVEEIVSNFEFKFSLRGEQS